MDLHVWLAYFVASWVIAVSPGSGAVLLASTTAFMVVKLLGAGYLIWLGVKQWRARVDAAPQDSGAAAEPAGLSTRQRLVRGALTNATNPKGIVFMVAVLPQFIDPRRPLAWQLAILLVTTVAVDTVVMHGYALLASRLRVLLRSARARRTQNRVFGGVLVGMGASLLMVDRAVKAG